MVNSMKSVYITDYLERNAKEMPNKPAVIFNDQMLTYEELLQKVATCAGHIQSKIRVAPDEENQKQYIVGLLLPNSIDFLMRAYNTFIATLSLVSKRHQTRENLACDRICCAAVG